MNILVTGMTSLQVNPKRRPIRKIDVPEAMVNGLEAMGHSVNWCRWSLTYNDAAMNYYDLAIIGLSYVQSWSGRYGLQALYAVEQLRRLNKPFVIFFDDWQIEKFYGEIAWTRKNYKKQFYKKLGDGTLFHTETGGHDFRWVKKREKDILSAMDFLLTDLSGSRAVALCPMYNFGKPELFHGYLKMKPKNIYTIDPTPAVIDMTEIKRSAPARSNGWLLASLSPQDKWAEGLQLDWPVTYVGAKKIGAPRLKTEEDVRELYKTHVGVLAPPYPHVGSGWFRSRFVYAALHHCVLYGHHLDLETFYGIGFDPHEFEKCGPRIQRGIAKAQRESVLDRMNTMKGFYADLDAVVRGAKLRRVRKGNTNG